jgi:hypothetical protein
MNHLRCFYALRQQSQQRRGNRITGATSAISYTQVLPKVDLTIGPCSNCPSGPVGIGREYKDMVVVVCQRTDQMPGRYNRSSVVGGGVKGWDNVQEIHRRFGGTIAEWQTTGQAV